MSLAVRYHESARADLFATWTWYEDQQAGLGDRFADAVDAVVLRATRWPNSGSPTMRDAEGEVVERKMPTPGFPYAVRYRVIDRTLMVMAVAHQHRDPGFGKDRTP